MWLSGVVQSIVTGQCLNVFYVIHCACRISVFFRTKLQVQSSPGPINLQLAGSVLSWKTFEVRKICKPFPCQICWNWRHHSLVCESCFYKVLLLFSVHLLFHKLVPVAERSKAWVSSRSPAEIVASNPTGVVDVCSECCVLQVEISATSWSLVQRSPTDCGESLCDLENLVKEEALAHGGMLRQKGIIAHDV